jgi:hypothetical protein
MTPAFSARRRADEFEALVGRAEGAGPEAPLSERDAELFAELLEVVADLRALPEATPRPAYVADLRERLMAEADTVLLPGDPVEARLRLPVRHTRRERRLATLLGGAAVIGATSSMAVAAQTALPGDTLYPIKRAMESVEAQLAGDGHDEGEALLASASDRLVEVDELARRGTPEGVAAVPDTLSSFTTQSDEASRLLLQSYRETGEEQSITDLREFTEQSMERLLELEAVVPASARDELLVAAQHLAAIDDLTRQLCPACPGEGITSIPPVLLSAGIVPDGVAPVPTAQQPLVPAARPRATDRTADRATDQATDQDEIELPDLDGAIDPDSGATGGGSADGGDGDGAPSSQPTQDPVKELTTVLTGGTKTSTDDDSTTSGSTEPLTDVLEGLGQTVDDTTGSLLD